MKAKFVCQHRGVWRPQRMRMSARREISCKQYGFTLLELVIAMGILAVLAAFTTAAIRSAMTSRGRYIKDVEREAQVRDCLRIIERDLNLAFHYRDALTPMIKKVQAEQAAAAAANAAANGGPPVVPPAGADAAAGVDSNVKQLTGFVGQKDEINFSSLSNVRLILDAQESDQAEIGYRLSTCNSPSQDLKKVVQSSCLRRRLAPYIDEELDKGGEEQVLIANVVEFKLRYWSERDQDWAEAWDSFRGPSSQKGLFPLAVEVSLKVKDETSKDDKPIAVKMIAAINFPNNPKPGESAAGVAGTDANGKPTTQDSKSGAAGGGK